MSATTDPPLHTLADFEALANTRMPAMAREYIAGAAGDEITLRRNRERLDAVSLLPRSMRDVSHVDTSLTLLGVRHTTPILLAPTASHRLLHERGEIETAIGAARAGVTLVVSSVANTPLAEVARAAPAGRRWFQLYIQRDRGFTRDIVAAAESSGYKALVLTVDTPVLGARDREKRADFAPVTGLPMANLPLLPTGPTAVLHHDPHSIYNPHLDASVTWKDLAALCAQTRLPVVVKGILAPQDAVLAIEHGAAAVIVSNHGGRNLDTACATIDALPGVVAALSGRAPVLMDGGVRRGTDVLKALALGASAILIGRPYLWGLAVSGADGVARVVEILDLEFQAALALCGITRLDAIEPGVLWREP